MTENSVHLTLTGRLTFDDEISLGEATQIIAFIDSARAGSSAGIAAPGAGASISGASVAPKERQSANVRDALEQSGAKTNPEKIVAFAAHVVADGELETFTLDAIRPLFRRAREGAPANINRDLDKAVAAGWIADGDVKGEYYLTARAEDVLEVGFEVVKKRGGSTGRTRAAAPKKNRTVKVPDAFDGVDVVATPVPEAPLYGALKLKRDKLLWALKLSKELSMPGLSNQEIVWLTDKLGDGIPSSDINGHFKGLQKAGYANRSTIDSVMRMTDSGDTYLKSLLSSDG